MEDYKDRHPEEVEGNYEYDANGEIIWSWKKEIDPLPTLDHAHITYPPFVRDCYEEHSEIVALSPMEVFELRNTLDVRVFGNNPPKVARANNFNTGALLFSPA